MAKNDNAHAVRFLNSMIKHGEQEAGERFAEEHPLSKSANPKKRSEWAKNVCDFLNDNYDDETVKAIRQDCICGPSKSWCATLKSIYEKDKTPDVFAENINKLNCGLTLEYDGEYYYLIYPQCYCSCVNKTDEQLPGAWCYCTLGYTKKMFECIFDKEVQAELISSVKMGDNECRIKISV